MKVEYSENVSRVKNKKRRKRSKAKGIIMAVCAVAVVLGVTVALMLTVFFNVAVVKVVGSSIYTADEIIYASGIIQGDNLLRLPTETIEGRIEAALPYIKKADIIKSYPDTAGIKVTPAVESLIIKTNEGRFAADSDYKILRALTEDVDDLPVIRGIVSSEVTPGKILTFDDKQQRDVLNDLIKICSEKGFSVNYIDIESLINISFVIDGRLYVKLGSYNDMSGKITHLAAMLETVDSNVNASISLTEWSVDNKKAVLKYEDITDLVK